ncbi:hypothetical protein LIER_36886 [Lithospermum erythrorhizon]|uniref:RNase H type-1 domain-containing protein n=1 Tax=Lithospermum erythrorhizon TaxID=34254 RepID=A0AAV3PBW1_LITER
MDASLGYHQIKMYHKDEEKTNFITDGLGDFEPGLNNPEWVLYVDGARNENGLAAGVLIRGPDGVTMEYALRYTFPTTNNKAE